MTLEDRALCDRVAREVMGEIAVASFDPLHDDRDFCVLLMRCARELGWRPTIWYTDNMRGRTEWTVTLGQTATRVQRDDLCHRRALVLAALAAVEVERGALKGKNP